MTTRSVLATAAFLTCLAVPAAYAQNGTTTVPTTRNPIEIGIDAGAMFGLDDPHVTTITIPGQQIRVGFPVSPRLSLEPVFGLNYIHASGESQTSYRALLGMLYHLSTDRRANQLYVRPFVGFVGNSANGDNTTQAALGAGVGIKVPLYPRLGARFEANYTHTFSSGGADDSNAIGLLAGLSFYTR
jgi:hypothetical protein